MTMIAYLDNASTTKPSEAAVAASLDALASCYGNPSSAHSMGQEAERAVKGARRAVAESIGADPDKIVFTGSGTESDNLALNAASARPGGVPCAIVVSSVEHPAVGEPAARLSELGAALFTLPVDEIGMADPVALEHTLEKAIRKTRRAVVSVMHVSNELGTVQPIAKMARVKARLAEKAGAEILFHTDAIQSYLKLPIDVSEDLAGVDLISLSAHKAHGPKGVGALYAAAPQKIIPLVRGGGQESGARSGTENVPGIAGFGAAAAELAAAGLREAGERAVALRARLLQGIVDAIPDVRVNSPAEASVSGKAGHCSPYILNVSFLGTRGEVVLHDLEQQGVFVSTGSACSNIGRGTKKGNAVLAAAGLTRREAEGAIRFSLSRYSTEEEIDYALERLKAAIARFRKVGTFR